MRPKLPAAERLALTVEEAAQQLAISRAMAYALVRRGELPSVKVGTAIRIPRRALEAWMDAHTEGRSA